MKGCKQRLMWSTIVGILRVVASLSFVWICKLAMDVATGKQHGSLMFYIVLMIGVLLLQLLFSNLASWQRDTNYFYISNKLRLNLFRKIMNSLWNGRDKMHTGDMMSRMDRDIETVSASMGYDMPQSFIIVIQLLAASAFLFVLQKELLFVLLCIMPLALLSSKLYFRTMRQLTKQVREIEGGIESLIQENIQNRILVKAMGTLHNVIEMLVKKQGNLKDVYFRRLLFSTRSRFFVQLGFQTGYAVTFIWGVIGIQRATVTYGMMTAFLQLVNQVQRPIVDLSRYIPKLVQTLTSVDRLKELDSLAQEVHSKDIMLNGQVGVKINNLTYCYPGNDIPTLKEFSYDFKPGTSTAVIGETGAGKSTLIRLILFLLKADKGELQVYNDEASESVSVSTRCNFMYVPQGNSLLSGTVRDNLLLANPNATDKQMLEALYIAEAKFLESKQGLDTLCSEKGGGLSEGQAQRIAIARAILHPGSVIILDEASSALDVETEKKILKALGERMNNKTLIWITHHEAVATYMTNVLKIGTFETT